MQSLRRRGASLARQSRIFRPRQSRSYASGHGDGHGHHSPPQVEESMGTAFYIAFGGIPASVILYNASQPGADGQPSSITKLIERASDFGQIWETRNNLHTEAVEQAAQDKHLFYNADRNKHIELKYPEIFQHGSPYNVPAGHYVNMDKVVAHYRKQHQDEEDRKAKKLVTKQSE